MPGELIEDVDGYPLAVGQTQTFTATLTARITRTDLHNAQLDEREVHRVNQMLIRNGPTPLDARRALALIKYTAPGSLDLAGINAIFDEISEDARSCQALLAMAAILHGYVPHLSTAAGLQALQNVIERHRIYEIGQEDD